MADRINVDRQDKLDVSFTNGALTMIKDLASYYSVSDKDLKNVLIKGLQIMTEVKNAGTKHVIIEDLNGKREKIDISAI